MPTLLHRNSKSDTVLLLDAAEADIFVDFGPARTNLADNTTYISENPSARAAIGAPRNVAIVVAIGSDDGGLLLQLGTVVTYSYRVRLLDSVISVGEAGATVLSLDVPAIEKDAVPMLVHWSTRVEGANVVSELAIYNFTEDVWAFATATHAAATPVATDTLTIGAGTGGASAYTGGIGAFTAVHIGRRFHSTTEASEDWVGESTPPAFDGYDRTPLLTGAAADLAIAGEGNFAGPSLLWAGASTRQAAQRCVGPFVNARPLQPTAEYVTSYPPHFYRATPDAWGQWCVRYLWHGYLSPKANVARVRAHVRCFDTFGDVVISPVKFRSYSIADLPVGVPGPAMTYYRGSIVTVTTTSTAGVWLDLGVVRLARSASGLSYFALGFFVDATEDEGDLYSTTWELNALTVDPYAKDLETGGFGDVDDKAAP